MSWRLLSVLAVLGLAGLALGAYFVFRMAYIRFEVLYDRPQGEPETLRLRVWVPPFLRFQVQREPEAEPEPGSGGRGWVGEVLTKGWTAVRQIQVVQQTIASLMRHDPIVVEEAARLRRGAKTILRVLRRVPWESEELSWVTRFGTGDPALTGMLAGLLWGLKGVAFGLLGERMTFRQRPLVRVIPDFENVALRTTFRCIVRVRLGDIIARGVAASRRKRGASWKANTRLRV